MTVKQEVPTFDTYIQQQLELAEFDQLELVDEFKYNLPKECLYCNRKFKTTNALNAHKRFCVIYKGKGAEI